MTTAEIDSKKRKRKHKSKKGEEVVEAKALSNGAAVVEKSRKKSKKEHTPEPEVEDIDIEGSVDGEESAPEEDEARLNRELKQIAAKAKAAKEDVDEEVNEEVGSGANGEALGQSDLLSGTSMPSMENPTKFSELKLSERTMEAITTMGFETMTEIQQKTIPPLLR